MENTIVPKLPKKRSIFRQIFNKEFVISVIIPLVIFYFFNFLKMNLIGLILSGCWCVGVVILKFILEHKIKMLPLLGGFFSAIGLIGMILSGNPKFYLVEPIFEDIVIALLFFSSLFFHRSLIQIIVEDSYIGMFPEEFQKTSKYKSAWQILSIAWCVLNLSQAILRSILLFSVPLEVYYIVSMIYTRVSSPLLLVLSYWFPQWYWKRKAQNNCETVK
jgi:hypothetical protein